MIFRFIRQARFWFNMVWLEALGKGQRKLAEPWMLGMKSRKYGSHEWEEEEVKVFENFS